MTRRLIAAAAALAILALAPTSAQANAATDWNAITQDALIPGRPPGDAEVMIGTVQAAVFDAANAIEGGYTPYAGAIPAPRGASPDAAVAAAAHTVAVHLVPGQQARLDAAYAAYLAALPNTPGKTTGVAVGEAAAANVIALRQGDGLDDTTPFVPPAFGPGVWQPTLPTPAIDPNLGRVRPFALRTPSQFRPPGPLALTSRRYAADLAETEALGSVDSLSRTQQQTETAFFWSDNTAADWDRAVRVLAMDRGLDLEQSARLFAFVHAAAADALIGCFDAKYHYLSWRPVQAIQHAGIDGNPRTQAEPTWTPLLNVNHPEYPSGHGCFTGAVTAALTRFFKSGDGPVTVFSAVTNTSRTYARFADALADAGNARVWAGLHFRHAILDGNRLGERVANYVAHHLFLPVWRARTHSHDPAGVGD
jgi:PAP2 superfamily